METNNKSFIYVLLISIIVCALIGFLIVKSSESYNPTLYSEVYDEMEEFEKTANFVTDNSKYANGNMDWEDETSDYEDSDVYKRGRIIAIITIDKIDLKYPILKDSTDENLKVAPTKFWGAGPNEVGNFCVVGHNYGNAKYFSHLNQLVNGDIVKVMDKKGNVVSYKVYAKEIINENNVDCTSQRTDGKKEVTLLTCTANSTQRLAVRCKEV